MFGFIGKIFKILLLLLGLAFLLGYLFGSANAMEYNILLDDTCIALIKINSTACPTYDQILTVFPDQSYQYISGSFEYTDGYYHRGSPVYKKNHFGYYEFEVKDRLWIDAPHDIRMIAKNIVITSHMFEYPVNKVGIDTTVNNTLLVGQNRFVRGCNDAIITANDWILRLGDTLYYLQHGCKSDATHYSDTKITTWKRNYHDIATSFQYKFEQWQKQSIEKCGKVVCIPK